MKQKELISKVISFLKNGNIQNVVDLITKIDKKTINLVIFNYEKKEIDTTLYEDEEQVFGFNSFYGKLSNALFATITNATDAEKKLLTIISSNEDRFLTELGPWTFMIVHCLVFIDTTKYVSILEGIENSQYLLITNIGKLTTMKKN